MINFQGITHLTRYPSGRYGFVGAVPAALLTARKPTTADIMGGRVAKDGLAYVDRAFQTVEEAISLAKSSGANLCSSKTCACRELF